jgi:DnaK suppressor protein
MSHLSAQQTREFDQLLAERHKNLVHEVHEELMESKDERYQALAGELHDSAEESVADLISDLHYRRVDQLAQELYGVEGAMARLRNGSYGMCEECNSEINIERLRAVPTASRCIDCQERHEHSYNPQATPSL